jgi:hypothetical protein
MKVTLIPIMTLFLIACAGERPIGPCGESFCLPADAQLLSKRTPVEDFNLYQVAWRGAQFGIYEGNHPRGRDDVSGSVVRLPGGRAGTLRLSGGHGNVILDTQNDWPAYLSVMGPCRSTEDCSVKSLALELTLRT